MKEEIHPSGPGHQARCDSIEKRQPLGDEWPLSKGGQTDLGVKQHSGYWKRLQRLAALDCKSLFLE